MEEEKKREIATFRFGVISDLVVAITWSGVSGSWSAFILTGVRILVRAACWTRR